MYALLAYSSTATERSYLFDVPKTSADIALNIIAQQAGAQALFPFDKVRLIETNKLRGVYTLIEALRLALEGTGMSADFTERGVIRVKFKQEQFRLDGQGNGAMMTERKLPQVLSVAMVNVTGGALQITMANPDFSPVDAMIAQDIYRQRVPEPAPYLIRGLKA